MTIAKYARERAGVCKRAPLRAANIRERARQTFQARRALSKHAPAAEIPSQKAKGMSN